MDKSKRYRTIYGTNNYADIRRDEQNDYIIIDNIEGKCWINKDE